MSRILVTRVVLAGILASFVMACSEGVEVDPYATVTLRQASFGNVVSKNFKYKFVNPQIVALQRNLGLIREGNRLEFIAARSLEDKLHGHTDGPFELAVVKKYSPILHYKVERITTPTDTVFPAQAGGIAFPTITTPAEYGVDLFEEQDIDKIPFNNTGFLRPMVNKKLKVSGKIVTEKVEGNVVYYLEGAGAKLRIGDMTDGTALIVKMLVENNYLFEGGIMMTEVEPFADRRKNRVAGTFDVQYVMYGDRLITGG